MLVGHSAGGQLALWAAKRAASRWSRWPRSPTSATPSPAAGPRAHPPATWRPSTSPDGSPLELLPLGVPQILVHGTADDTVPYEMSERYVAAAGGEAELVTLDGAGHFELIDPLSAEWPVVRAAIERLLETRGSDARPR